MAKQLQLRRGTTTEHASFTGVVGEVTVDTDKDTAVVHDGSTAGGTPLATEGWLSSKSHIIPGVLYPSSGNDLAGSVLVTTTNGPNGSTVATSKYGTVQASDGRMYYYTDIKGSKPIKDPRIGAHFGSQRHKTKSLQLLEQETATHGFDVFSVDGREWMRVVNTSGHFYVQNASAGQGINTSAHTFTGFLEITGYFNNFNLISYTAHDEADDINVTINGGTTRNSSDTDKLAGRASVITPLGSRYVDAGSVINHGDSNVTSDLGTTPKINTIRIEAVNTGSEYWRFYGIELIAQDTTSTATKSQIQIPSQNVVSFGKKFTVAETKHYNPFAYKTDGSTVWASGAHNSTAWPIGTGSSTNIDTATSLGLAAWVSTNYYKPYNGGRVVKWVASDGTIKTSVNMMPPNARSILTTAISAKANAAVENDTYLPTFEAGTVDHSLAEVAKTYMFREFGNGNANAGTHATTPVAPYADASMLNTLDDFAYVMDDGLTSMSANDMLISGDQLRVYNNANEEGYYITFIGTGISIDSSDGIYTVAQNLPYGTHIMWCEGDGSNVLDNGEIKIDGVQVMVRPTWAQQLLNHDGGFSFHQPKMPPIPEDAVVIADYMLMADFVGQGAVGIQYISKGVRNVSCTRDLSYPSSATYGLAVEPGGNMGFRMNNVGVGKEFRLNGTFSNNFVLNGYQTDARSELYLDGSTQDSSATKDNTAAQGSYSYITTNYSLGVHEVGHNVASDDGYFSCYQIASPIHTSSHYQTFETPFLHELVGGDRNMEQTNLVVTPDGKTWDEVTRDVSYIGNGCVSTTTDTAFASGIAVILDDWRGNDTGTYATFDLYNKDFAIAYDRLICLKDGTYTISAYTIEDTAGDVLKLMLNGTADANILHRSYQDATTYEGHSYSMTIPLKRGDFLIQQGGWHSSTDYSRFEIIKG
jgi:hypothetical protein